MMPHLKILSVLVFCGLRIFVDCKSYGTFNTSLLEEYLKKLPLDGISFFKIFSQRLKESGEEDECAQQVDLVLQNPDAAIQMFDAWTKLPAGLLWTSGADWGMFDECLNIDLQTTPRVLGKHCAYGLIIPYTADASGTFKYSYCIPDKCNKTHIVKALQLSDVLSNLILDKYCTTKYDVSTWETPEILSATLIVVVALLMIFSTCYDVWLYYIDRNPAHPLLVAFSLYSNGKKLFHISSPKSANEQVLVFHGLKTIGMCWIIAGHNGVIYQYMPLDNYQDVKSWLSQDYTAYLQAAHLAVDTFFFISGFLLAYLYFKSESQKPAMRQIVMIPYAILHRYLRLTPALLMIYLFYTYIMIHLESGPLKNGLAGDSVTICKNNWWSIFLYIQNYHSKDSLCMTNLWYVAADMQLFVFAPLILIPIAVQYHKSHFKVVMAEMCILSLFTALLPVWTKLQFRDYDPNFEEYDTHSRIVDYVMGMTLGIFIRGSNFNPNKMRPIVNVILWIWALGTMFSAVVLNEASFLSDDYVRKAIGLSLMRPMWCAGLCYVVWACYHGRGGIINWFLSCGLMQVGSRLTYAMYLIHGPVLFYWVYALRSPLHLSNFNMFYGFSGALVVTIIASLILSLGFESPVITIEKFIFGRVKPARPPPKQPTNKS